MDLPLDPVIASYYEYMEYFKLAISVAIRKPNHWYRYVDYVFVWPHGKQARIPEMS